MTEPPEHEHEIIHALEHPLETVEEIMSEADEGRSPWTPFIALSGLIPLLVVIVAVVLGLAFLAYYAFS